MKKIQGLQAPHGATSWSSMHYKPIFIQEACGHLMTVETIDRMLGQILTGSYFFLSVESLNE